MPINSIGWRDATRVYLLPATWRDIHPANEATQAARNLRDLGVLMPGDSTGLTSKAPRSIPDRPRVYVLQAAMVLDEAANLRPSTDSAPALASGA